MTDADVSQNAPDPAQENGGGLLAKLPRTRPQRASPRRAAARRAASVNGRPTTARARPTALAEGKSATDKRGAATFRPATQAETASDAPPSSGRRPRPVADSAASTRAKATGHVSSRPPDAARAKAAKRPAAARRPLSAEQPAPRQGYECESDRANSPVAPPGGPELVASAAELMGELAKAGFSAGERLLKDVLSRLPGG